MQNQVEKDARACLHIKPEIIKGYKRLALAQRKLGNLKGALDTVEAGVRIDWTCCATLFSMMTIPQVFL